jgi:hypothetical protein
MNALADFVSLDHLVSLSYQRSRPAAPFGCFKAATSF